MQCQQFDVAQAGAADPGRQSEGQQVGRPGHGVGGLPERGVDLAGQVLGLNRGRSARSRSRAWDRDLDCGPLIR